MRTALLLCADLEFVGIWAGRQDAEVHVVPGLCAHPDGIRTVLAPDRIDRLVLGVCDRPPAIAEVQAESRRLAIDPLGVETVALKHIDPDTGGVLLAGAVARAQAFAGSKPENAKIIRPSHVTRRSFLRLSSFAYSSAPSVDFDGCVADRGCRACLEACPQGAIRPLGGRVVVDNAVCDPCGLCVTACPVGAVVNPACTPRQMEAQITAMVAERGGQGAGIVFVCEGSPTPRVHSGWVPVVLSCVGMAPATWILAPLAIGAGAVAIVPAKAGCPPGAHDVAQKRTAFCREFLRLIAWPEDRVEYDPDLARPPAPGERRLLSANPFEAGATFATLRSLADARGPPDVFLVHTASPLGVVRIREATCTGCGMCARTCPTEALRLSETNGGVEITFDPRNCSACGACVPPCPERRAGAITLLPTVDLARLGRGRETVYASSTATCVACGASIAPLAMVNRVTELLGGEHASTAAYIGRYCLDCRGLAHA